MRLLAVAGPGQWQGQEGRAEAAGAFQERAAWIADLDAIAARHPDVVMPGRLDAGGED